MPTPQESPLFNIKPKQEYQSGEIEAVPELPEQAPDIPPSPARAISVGNKIARKQVLIKAREAFESRFSTWIPFSQGELSLAITGLTVKANKVLGRIGDNTLSITEQAYENAQRYRDAAGVDFTNLEDAKILEEDLEPSAARIREIPEVTEAMAKYLQAVSSLERLSWYQGRGTRKTAKPMPKEQELKEIIGRLQTSPDERLVEVWHQAELCARARRDFWDLEITNTESSNELVQGLKSEDMSRRA